MYKIVILNQKISYVQSKILHYMRQMAVITPYAQFLFKFVSDSSEYALSLTLFLVEKQMIVII